MYSQEIRHSKKQQNSTFKRALKAFLQVVAMVALFAVLLWYVGIDDLYTALLNIKIEYLAMAFLMYFGINVLFALRLQRVLGKDNIKTSFGKTLLAQYAGMLTSDVTPGRSGYILTPVYLKDQNVPSSKALSTILGIQTIEFLIKVVGGIGAVIYLVKYVPTITWTEIFPQTIAGINSGIIIAGLGIGLMLLGATILALCTWSKKALNIFQKALSLFPRIARPLASIAVFLIVYLIFPLITSIPILVNLFPIVINSFYLTTLVSIIASLIVYFIFPRIISIQFLKRSTGGIMSKLEEFKESAHNTQKAIPEIIAITLICWLLKGLEWWFLGMALGINVPWIAFFLIHPLVTALAFVPITPAGIGVQEIGIVGILGLLGIPVATAGAFAIIARGLLILEDLIGLPQIVKSTSLLFTNNKQQTTPENPTTQIPSQQHNT